MKKFKKTDLQELIHEESCENTDLEFIRIEDQDHGRWESHHTVYFKEKSSGKIFGCFFSKGLTEYQETRPLEYAGNEVNCGEFEPYEEVIIRYRTAD